MNGNYVLNTEAGPIVIEHGHWGGPETVHFKDYPNLMVNIGAPPRQHSDKITKALVNAGSYLGRDSDVDRIHKLGLWAVGICEYINAANAEERQRIAAERAEREKVIQKERSEKDKRESEREEMLKMEYMGDRVKIRHRGYKTMCYGETEVVPIYPGGRRWQQGDEEPVSYKLVIRYTDQGDSRDMGIRSYQRVDVKTDTGWLTLWDDGKEDLPEWDRGVKLPKARPIK